VAGQRLPVRAGARNGRRASCGGVNGRQRERRPGGVLRAAAEPSRRPALRWRAAGTLGIGATAAAPARDRRLITIASAR